MLIGLEMIELTGGRYVAKVFKRNGGGTWDGKGRLNRLGEIVRDETGEGGKEYRELVEGDREDILRRMVTYLTREMIKEREEKKKKGELKDGD